MIVRMKTAFNDNSIIAINPSYKEISEYFPKWSSLRIVAVDDKIAFANSYDTVHEIIARAARLPFGNKISYYLKKQRGEFYIEDYWDEKLYWTDGLKWFSPKNQETIKEIVEINQ